MHGGSYLLALMSDIKLLSLLISKVCPFILLCRATILVVVRVVHQQPV